MILHDVKYAHFQGFNIKPGDTQQFYFESLSLFEPETQSKNWGGGYKSTWIKLNKIFVQSLQSQTLSFAEI